MSKVQNGPVLNYKDMYKISRMRVLGHTWKDIKAAMPHKNIYEKYVRYSEPQLAKTTLRFGLASMMGLF